MEKIENKKRIFMTTSNMILSGNGYTKEAGKGYVFAGYNHVKNMSQWVWEED